jgi:nucleotide-binding universal stress UspA family protein
MFTKILVAIDNSALGEQVFREALLMTKATNGRLLLLHVLSDEEIGYPDIHNLSDHLSQWQEYKKLGIDLLQSRQQSAIETGVSAEIAQTTGVSGKTICEIATAWSADVIIVGHRGLSGIREWVQGSVSNYLVHHAPCSVLTIAGQEEPSFKKIVVGIDGSTESRHAFDAALSLAQVTAASLQLLHVFSVEEKGSPSILSLTEPDFERKWEVFAQPRLEMLRSYQEVARSAGVEADIHQKLGTNPGRALCDLAYSLQADLIVVGRRGISGLGELLMGSVSNYVIHYAACSVLTVQGQFVANPTHPENQLTQTV